MLPPSIAGLLHRTTEWLERSEWLDRPSDALQKVTGKLPPGMAKDLLSGTPIGHPAHPMLVLVPIGGAIATVVVDLFGDDPRASRRLLGVAVLGALPAAAAGLSDWDATLGGERRVGLAHAACSLSGMSLLAWSWLARGRGHGGKVSAVLGTTILGGSGWLGGHLAYALGVGVDTTAFQHSTSEWADACAEDDLDQGAPQVVDLSGQSVLLVRRGTKISAIANRCTHRGGPLAEGKVTNETVECPWHESRFRLGDGTVECGPATRPQPVYQTRVVDGRVQLRRDEVRTLRTNPVG